MENIFKSRPGIILMSIIWGLGISCLFRQVCKGKDCIVLVAPDPKSINNKVFKYEDKCFQYVPYNSTCTADSI